VPPGPNIEPPLVSELSELSMGWLGRGSIIFVYLSFLNLMMLLKLFSMSKVYYYYYVFFLIDT